MIVSVDRKHEEATKHRYELERFFLENKQAVGLKERYRFKIGIERLGQYMLVTITPILTDSLKNTLQYLLKEKFPHSFIVPDMRSKESLNTVGQYTPTKMSLAQESIYSAKVKEKSFWGRTDMQWIALVLLALAGAVLLYKNIRYLIKIRVLQKEIQAYQFSLENEMKSMEVGRV